MAKSKRILSAVLSFVMVLTMIPLGIFGTAAAEGGILTASSATPTDPETGRMRVPDVSLTSTKVIRTASAAGAITPGTTIVKATPSGLPDISGKTYATQFYANETPVSPTVVFTINPKEGMSVVGTPTVSCTNVTGISFSAPAVSGNTYTWTITGGQVTVGSLNFTVGYSYSYTDEWSGETYTYSCQAFASSQVEKIAQPATMAVYRERSAPWTTHEREQCHYVWRILGADTYGSYYQYNDLSSGNWTHGYYDWTAASSRRAWNNLGTTNQSKDYATVIHDTGTSGGYGGDTGSLTSNTELDHNRPVSTTYIDRGSAPLLTSYNLRTAVFEANLGRSDYKFYVRYSGFLFLPGESVYSSSDNSAARTELGLDIPASDLQVSAGSSTVNYFKGITYPNSAVDLDNGNKQSTYTVVVNYGTVHTNASDRVSNVSSAINVKLVSYDKSELRGQIKDYNTFYIPTVVTAGDSEKGLYPQSFYYSAGWDNYKSKLVNAQNVLSKANTDQKTIDAALADVKTAYNGLVVKEADCSALDTLINRVSTEFTPSNYTDATWNALTVAVQEATAAKEAHTSVFYQAVIDRHVNEIEAAIKNLKEAPASMEKINQVLEAYEALDPTKYTPESWKNAYNAALQCHAVLAGEYTISQQAYVDSMAVALATAISGLEDALANYTEANAQKAIYLQKAEELYNGESIYENFTRATNAYNGIEWGLKWYDQDLLDEEVDALASALAALKLKSADYTALDQKMDEADVCVSNQEKYEKAHPGYTYYEQWAYDEFIAVYDRYDSVLNKPITEQADVDALTAELTEAIENLKTAVAMADYDAFYEALDRAESIAPDNYTEDSWLHMDEVAHDPDFDFNLTAAEQATVDGYTAAILAAIDALQEKTADYSRIEDAIAAWNSDSGKDLYTNEYKIAVTEAFNAVQPNLPNSQQSRVDAWADAIEALLANPLYKPADYTAVNSAKAAAAAAINKNTEFAAAHGGYRYYTADSLANLNAALSTVVEGYDIRRQDEVTAMAAAVNAAINALQPNPADYSGVDAALASIPADLSIYSEESVARVMAAKLAVDRTLTIDYQDDIDEMAQAITDAVNALEEAFADYTAVDKAITVANAMINMRNEHGVLIHTDASIAPVNEAINAVVRGLYYKDQAAVDLMAEKINKAVENLVKKPADYTAVDNAAAAAEEEIAKTIYNGEKIYTDESIEAVNNAINAVVAGKTIEQQAVVDAMAAAIDAAVAELKLKAIDTSAFEKLAAQAKAKIESGLYTDASVKAVNDAKLAADTFLVLNKTITSQEAFDALVSALESAVNAMQYRDADYSAIDTAKKNWQNDPNKAIYTEASKAAVDAAIDAVVYGKKADEQTAVDEMAKAIADAVEKLEYIDADYTSVTDAVNAWDNFADKANYTDASVSAVNDAVNAVVYGKKANEQAAVEAMADAINDAMSHLEMKLADYTELKNLCEFASNLNPGDFTNYDEIYWLYIDVMINETVPANSDYKIDRQDEVDAMTAELQGYLDMLEYLDADYTMVEKAKTEALAKAAATTADLGLQLYTDDSIAAVNSAVAAIVYGLKKNEQAKVDAMAAAIKLAAENLIERDADYTKLDNLIKYTEELVPEDYKNYDEIYWAYIYPLVIDVIPVNRSLKISDQAQVNALADELQEYINMLIPVNPVASEKFELTNGAKVITKGGVEYLVGLKTKLTKSALLNNYMDYENVTVTVQSSAGSKLYIGTGSTVTVTSNLTGEVLYTYVVVIYGDINGDGNINAADRTELSGSLGGTSAPLAGANKVAGNINGDLFTNTKDVNALTTVLNGTTTIDQSTGKLI